jgi:acetyl-CoA C-acetyltransferase
MVAANGNYITKQSFGIYSTSPVRGTWRREGPAQLQAQIDALPHESLVTQPSGPATIETYTVLHGASGPEYAIVLGRLAESGERFVANTPKDRELLCDLQERESLGRHGTVRAEDGRNVFLPEDV